LISTDQIHVAMTKSSGLVATLVCQSNFFLKTKWWIFSFRLNDSVRWYLICFDVDWIFVVSNEEQMYVRIEWKWRISSLRLRYYFWILLTNVRSLQYLPSSTSKFMLSSNDTKRRKCLSFQSIRIVCDENYMKKEFLFRVAFFSH
jgi:hypothetical protein